MLNWKLVLNGIRLGAMFNFEIGLAEFKCVDEAVVKESFIANMFQNFWEMGLCLLEMQIAWGHAWH